MRAVGSSQPVSAAGAQLLFAFDKADPSGEFWLSKLRTYSSFAEELASEWAAA